jgi:hypothetical protein
MRINEIINEDEWQRITPADLPTPVATDADANIAANKKFNKENPTKTNKLPWWRSTTTDPAAVQFRKDMNRRAAVSKDIHDPERISQISKFKPVPSSFVTPRGELVDIPFTDEYAAAQKKIDTQERDRVERLSKTPTIPAVSPDNKMMPDVKSRKIQT